MGKFKKGDMVLLARKSKSFGSHGINSVHFGDEVPYRVQNCYPEYERDNEGNFFSYYYVIGGSCNEMWGVYEDMLDPFTPLSPFDQRVRAYIQRELPNG